MRIGEIAIVGLPGKDKTSFIKSICQPISDKDGNMTFGQLQINDQLTLHLYGISIDEKTNLFAWDLVSTKMLGYVVLFNWFDETAISKIAPVIDFFEHRYGSFLVIAAYIDDGDYPLPESFIKEGIPLTPETRLVFCKLGDETTNKRAVVTLINMIIDKLP